MPFTTPSRSFPGIFRSRLRCKPNAISTALKPCWRKSSRLKSRPSRMFSLSCGPSSRISRIWACKTSRGKRYSGRAGTNDRHLFRTLDLGPIGENVDGVSGLRSKSLGHEALQRPDGNRSVELPATARTLARVPAHTAADGCEWIGGAGVAVGILIAPLCNQRYVPSGLCVDGTRRHAREVGFQPLQIDELAASRPLVCP